MLRDNRTVYVNVGGDTETVDGDVNCFQLSLDGESAHIWFTTPDKVESEFLNALDALPKTRDRVYVIWFHNIAFDLPVLFPKRLHKFADNEFEFESKGWKIDGVYSHLCFVTMRKGEKTVQLLGTDSYFKTSLEKLAKTFCPHLPKLQAPKDIGKRRYGPKDKHFIAYAERDSLITHAVGSKIVEMHERYSIALCVSAPHMASRVFRKSFLSQTIPLPSMAIVYASLHAYHGGKNNFPVQRGLYRGVYCVDIKSAYPFAMSEFPSFSNRDLYFRFDSKNAASIRAVPSFGVYKICGVAHVTAWPVIFNHSFKPVFGPFSGIWITGFELNAALSSGLVDLHSCFGYFYDAASDNVPSPFAAYVKHFYEMKEKPGVDKGERDFYKLLMNSLYGKFIETRGASSLLNIRYDVDTGEHEETLELICGTLFNPFIAALITGHTRAYIHSLELNFEAIHTSTDGIMTRIKPEGLSGALGGLSIEAEGDVLLLRNKLYIVYTRRADRAAKDKAGQPLRSKLYPRRFIAKYALHGFFGDIRLLEEMIANDVYEYEFVKVNKLRESLRRGLKVNRFEKQRRILSI